MTYLASKYLTKLFVASLQVYDLLNVNEMEICMLIYALADLSVKRKIEKSREKVLRCDSLLQRNPFVQPVPSSIQKKKKSKKSGKAVLAAKDKDAAQDSLKVRFALYILQSDYASNLVRLFSKYFLSNHFRMKVHMILAPLIYGKRKVISLYVYLLIPDNCDDHMLFLIEVAILLLQEKTTPKLKR